MALACHSGICYPGSVGIGGIVVDITQWSGAFGGVSSLSIMDMLAYAAAQSNAGGSMWYGNVPSMQGLARDAFDAINDERVFAP
jgi:hypothetical protein